MNNKMKAIDYVLQESLERTVASKYRKTSHPAACVVTSFVEAINEWYMAIHTFNKGKRKVELNKKGNDKHFVLQDLATKFLAAELPATEMDKLKVMLAERPTVMDSLKTLVVKGK